MSGGIGNWHRIQQKYTQNMAEKAVHVTGNCTVTLNKQAGCCAGWIYVQDPQSCKKVLCALTYEADFKENGHF